MAQFIALLVGYIVYTILLSIWGLPWISSVTHDRLILFLPAFAIALGGPLVLLILFMNRPSAEQRRLAKAESQVRQDGKDGKAEVLEVRDMGMIVNETFLNLQLKLKVTDEGGESFETETTALFSQATLPRVGDVLRVKFDPQDHTKVRVVL